MRTVGPDAADASTKESSEHIPPSYQRVLGDGTLKGIRLGVVRGLFGTAPEDQEVTTAVNKSLDLLKQAGAEIVEVVIPGLDDLLRDSSVINAEFKFDLADYLARHPDAPVKSLGEILDRGMYHLALEGTFRARNAIEKRGLDAERRARVKRGALRDATVAVIEEHRLSALLYPTLRRKPARIGDAQGGTNCSFSAHSGLPALGVPAAWTDDGLPVGVDLVGRPWSEAQLLALGFGFEQTLKLRRPPFSTPALVNGKAPAPRALTVSIEEHGERLTTVDVSYDETAGRLTYKTTYAPKRDERVTAVWLQRAAGEKVGAAVHLLSGGAGTSGQGVVTLSYAERADFAAGKLRLRVYTKDHPAGIDATLAR